MLFRPLDVRVLDAQQHRSTVPAPVQQIEDRRPRTADVQEPGRRGSEAEFHRRAFYALRTKHYTSRVRQRGFTLVEVLAAIMILGLVITTSLAVFVERTKRQREATE